jgi:hypothetical protein
MSANDRGTAEALCAQWMPRKKTTCARTPGHGGSCMTAENMARRREYRRNRMFLVYRDSSAIPLVIFRVFR